MQPTRRLRRCLCVAAGLVTVAGAQPLAAVAADPKLPGASSAIRQYIEMIPTASGSQPTGTGGRKAEIPAATKRQIAKQAGEAAPLLERVVSSEAYGAPAQFQAPAETQPPPQPKPQQQQPQKQQPQKPVPKPRPTVTHETAPKPPRVLPPAELPAAPSPVSALTGTAGVEGVVFVGALALALGAGLLPRLRRQTN